MEILVKLLWYVNYIIFCTKNSLQNEKKNINHSNAEWHWIHGYITLMHDAWHWYIETQKGFLGICGPENSKHSMKNVFGGVVKYNDAKDH